LGWTVWWYFNYKIEAVNKAPNEINNPK
jgi:hypothetical protein